MTLKYGTCCQWLFFILLFCFYLKPESEVNLADILTPPIKICICVCIEKQIIATKISAILCFAKELLVFERVTNFLACVKKLHV